MNPVVSVIMPNYNNEAYIEIAIRSVLEQSYQNFELLVVDDCSTDSSLDIATRIANAHSNIKILIQTKNAGPARARNVGMENAKGKYIIFFDADDVMMEGRLDHTVKIFSENPEVNMIFGSYMAINEEGQLLNRELYFPNYLNNDNILLHELKRNYLWTAFGAIRREIAEKYRFDETLPSSEDYDYFLKLVYEGYQYYFHPKPIIQYRIHDNNSSAKMDKSLNATRTILNKYNFIELYERLVKTCTPKEIYNSFAVVCLIKQDYVKGIEMVKKALQYKGTELDELESLFNAGVLSYKLGQLGKAAEYLREARSVDASEPTILNNLAVVEALSNQSKDEIIALLEAAIQIQPIYNDAMANLQLVKESGDLKNIRFTEKLMRKIPVHGQNMIRG